jgi:hypothetical protein
MQEDEEKARESSILRRRQEEAQHDKEVTLHPFASIHQLPLFHVTMNDMCMCLVNVIEC